jgi:ankyrin repeat protein
MQMECKSFSKSSWVSPRLRLTSISFLLARLAMDILAPTSIKNLRQIKKFLLEKSLDLSEMYRATYSRIKSSDTATGELAQRVILWICYAQRPLHEVELQHAIATEIEDEDFDPDGITPGDLLRSSCMGLVTCDAEGTYSLFHLTAYEFFRSNADMGSDASHLLISRTCLTYLSFSSIGRQGPCESLATLEARKSQFRLLDYAAKYSADHIRQVEAALLEDVLSFLRDDALRQALMQAFYHRHRDDEDFFETLPSGFTPLEAACGQGLLLTAERMLRDGADPKAADLQGWTPLIAAASYGQLGVIQLLLSHAKKLAKHETSVAEVSCTEDPKDREDDITGLNQPDNDGWTPLFWAVLKNQYKAAETLLTAGACVSVRDGAKWTPLEWAAFRGDRAFVDLILRFTSGVQLKSLRRKKPLINHPEESSPSFSAAAGGDYRRIEIMLEFGVEYPINTEQNLEKFFEFLVKLKHSWIKSTGAREGRSRYATLVSSLVSNNNFSVKLLELAMLLDQRTIVKMLVELRASLGSVKAEVRKRSPLHIASLRPLSDLLVSADGKRLSIAPRQ